MSDIFISYKSEDRELIAPLAHALEQEGFSVWWDKKIAAGGSWRDTIATALDSAKVIVVAWSKRTEDSADAAWVFNEVDEAQRLRKPIIPVQLEACVIPLGYRHLQAANLIGWRGDKSSPEWQEVVAGVRAGLSGQRVGAAPSSARAAPPASSARGFPLPLALGAGVLALALAGGAYVAINGFPFGSDGAAYEELAAEGDAITDLSEGEFPANGVEPDAAVSDPTATADEGPTRPIAVMFGENGDQFRRFQGDIWLETDLAGTVRFQWVRMSGDAPVMELWDQSRDMWLRFDFDRGVIQLRIGDEPYQDQWPIAGVETEPME